MRTLPLRRFVDPRRPITYGIVQAGEDVPGGVPYIRPVDMDGHRGVKDPAELRTTSKDIASQYRRSELRAGDIVVSIGPSFGKTMVVPQELDGANLTQGTARVATDTSTSVGYLRWALQSELATGFWNASVGGATFRALNLEPLGRTPIPLWPLDRQRSIARFLDTETARIDALLMKKRRMSEVLAVKLDAERSRVIWSGSPPTTPLKRLTPARRQIMYGIVLPGPDVEEGVPIVKGGDVAAGLQRNLCRTTREIEARYARSRLQTDDLVFAIRGGVGDVGIVPSRVAGANITQDVARVAPRASVEPRWLLHVLKSPEVQAEASRRTTGATIRGLNIWDLRLLRVPAIDVELQRAQAEELEALESNVEQVASSLKRQLMLLLEHRQALITAAVTGELDIAEVAA